MCNGEATLWKRASTHEPVRLPAWEDGRGDEPEEQTLDGEQPALGGGPGARGRSDAQARKGEPFEEPHASTEQEAAQGRGAREHGLEPEWKRPERGPVEPAHDESPPLRLTGTQPYAEPRASRSPGDVPHGVGGGMTEQGVAEGLPGGEGQGPEHTRAKSSWKTPARPLSHGHLPSHTRER